MTEAEWQNCAAPSSMLKLLGELGRERKLRLFAVACCRRNWHLLDEEVSRPGVELIERYADGLATADDLEVGRRVAQSHGKGFEKLWDWHRNTRGASLQADSHYRESQQAYLVAHASQRDDYLGMVLIYTTQCKLREVVGIQPVIEQRVHEEWQRLCDADRAELTKLLRDIFGNPFRPAAADPSWLTSTVVSLAKQMYESRDFSTMPILADALQDADCDNDDILYHCRQPGEHVRGCWVVDLVLGKS